MLITVRPGIQTSFTFVIVFVLNLKHQDTELKIRDAQSSFVDEIQGSWECGQPLSWVFDTIIFWREARTNEKTKE